MQERGSGANTLVLLLAGACTTPGWHPEDSLAAEMIELQVNSRGQVREIEYHVPADMVPETVRAAMDALHPGGRATGAEKEYVGGTLYWELTKEIDGLAVEAMFLPAGTLHSEEIQVMPAAVPVVVKAAVAARMEGNVTQWEEIRDQDRILVEYHAKISADGKKYKIRASTSGTILGVVREVPAEIEVPIDS